MAGLLLLLIATPRRRRGMLYTTDEDMPWVARDMGSLASIRAPPTHPHTHTHMMGIEFAMRI
jgi:hypothetical protein